MLQGREERAQLVKLPAKRIPAQEETQDAKRGLLCRRSCEPHVIGDRSDEEAWIAGEDEILSRRSPFVLENLRPGDIHQLNRHPALILSTVRLHPGRAIREADP